MRLSDFDKPFGQGGEVTLRPIEQPGRRGLGKKKGERLLNRRKASVEKRKNVSDPHVLYKPVAPIKKYPHRKKNQKRHTLEIALDSKYQRKLKNRRGKYGHRVRKLKYTKNTPKNSETINRIPAYTRNGVLIRSHYQRIRNYKKRRAAKNLKKFDKLPKRLKSKPEKKMHSY